MKLYQFLSVAPVEPSPSRPRPAVRRRTRFGLALLLAFTLFLVLPSLVLAGDGALDPTFNPGLGVSKIPIIRGQADWTTGGVANGNSLIWGYFTSVTDSVQTYTRSSIAKLTDTNGTVDPNFNVPNLNGEVRGAMLADPTDPNSKMLIWGSFTLPSSGPTFYNLAGLKWDTSTSAYYVDPTFPVVFNQGGLVTSVAVMGPFDSSYVLVGGYNMQPVGGAVGAAYHLIRLTSGFTFDSTYTRALSLPGGYVNAIGISGSNQARVFGTLPQSGGGTHWVEILNSPDFQSVAASLSDSQIDGPVFNMTKPFGSGSGQPWLITGKFKTVFTNTLNNVALINSTFSGLDSTNGFNTNIMSSGTTTGGADHAVQQIFIDTGTGKIFLAGSLTNFNNNPCGHLVRLNTDGTVDGSFNSGGGGASDRIFRLYQRAGTAGLQITGAFQNYNGSGNPRHGIASLSIDGNLQIAYAGVNPTSSTIGTVYALEAQWGINGPQLIIGGDFTGVGGKFHQNLARLNPDGSVDDSFVSVVEGQVNAIRTLDAGQILIAGNFGQAQGYGCTSLARLNQGGGFDTTFKPVIAKGDGTTAGLRMVEREDNGNIDIGGNFASVYNSSHTPVSHTAFAILDSNGYDTGFNAQFNIPGVDKIKVNTGGNIGGGYGMVGYARSSGNDYGFACALDPSGSQLTYMLFDGEVLCATGLADGRIVFGGNFTNVLYPAPASRNHIAAITSSFTLDGSFAGVGADGPIWDMRTQGDHDNGKPLIAGAFSHYNGTARAGVARLNLNGSLDNSFNPGTGTGGTGPACSVTWFNNRAAFGGAFTSYNGTSMPGVAQVFASMGSTDQALYFLLLLED